MRPPDRDRRQYVYRWRYGDGTGTPGPWLNHSPEEYQASPESRGPIQAWYPPGVRTEEYELPIPSPLWLVTHGKPIPKATPVSVRDEVRRRHKVTCP